MLLKLVAMVCCAVGGFSAVVDYLRVAFLHCLNLDLPLLRPNLTCIFIVYVIMEDLCKENNRCNYLPH